MERWKSRSQHVIHSKLNNKLSWQSLLTNLTPHDFQTVLVKPNIVLAARTTTFCWQIWCIGVAWTAGRIQCTTPTVPYTGRLHVITVRSYHAPFISGYLRQPGRHCQSIWRPCTVIMRSSHENILAKHHLHRALTVTASCVSIRFIHFRSGTDLMSLVVSA